MYRPRSASVARQVLDYSAPGLTVHSVCLQADPYVLLYLDAPEVIDEVNSDPMGEAAMTGYLERSETKQAELYPTWNQDYIVAGENAITSTCSQLRLILMDASRVGRDEMLGVTVVQLTELLDQRRHIDWYTVQPVSSKVGQVRTVAGMLCSTLPTIFV